MSRHLRKWFGAPPGLTSVALYSKSAKLSLPLSSVIEEYKVTKVRALITLRQSRDPKVGQAETPVRTGHKWSAAKSLEGAESQRQHRRIVGTTTMGHQGLGYRKEHKEKRSERDQVLEEVRKEEENNRRAQAAGQRKQGAWLNWEGVGQRKLTWQEVWRKDHHLLKFLIRSVYDQLPTPANLATWGKREDPNCALCGKRGTLRHILSGCPVSLSQGRYRWRHDSVLRELGGAIDQTRRKARPRQKTQFINLCKLDRKAEKE